MELALTVFLVVSLVTAATGAIGALIDRAARRHEAAGRHE